jgi:hypothetical protein
LIGSLHDACLSGLFDRALAAIQRSPLCRPTTKFQLEMQFCANLKSTVTTSFLLLPIATEIRAAWDVDDQVQADSLRSR